MTRYLVYLIHLLNHSFGRIFCNGQKTVRRLGRSSIHLAKLLKYFIEEDIGFRSLSEGININTSSGKLMYHMIAGFAEFDADVIRENTISGLRAAKARGKHLGRPYKLTPKKITKARHLIDVVGVPFPLVAKALKSRR